MEAQLEERIARLKDEEELAELTVAVAALSKNSEDYWEAKFSNNRTKLEEDQSELSKLNELFAEKESYSKLQTLQLIEKEELGANIEMLAGAGETTLEQHNKDLLEELEGVRVSLVEDTAERGELSKTKGAMQEYINSLHVAAKEAEMKSRLRELERNKTTDMRQELSSAESNGSNI